MAKYKIFAANILYCGHIITFKYAFPALIPHLWSDASSAGTAMCLVCVVVMHFLVPFPHHALPSPTHPASSIHTSENCVVWWSQSLLAFAGVAQRLPEVETGTISIQNTDALAHFTSVGKM